MERRILGKKKRLLLAYYALVKSKRVVKKWAVKEINTLRKSEGDWAILVPKIRINDHETFYDLFRMLPHQFDDLLNIVGPRLERYSHAEPISPGERLAITLRFLATGDGYMTLATTYRVGRSTVSTIVHSTCSALWDALSPKVFMQPTEENWSAVAADFHNIWNFPNCVGAIDGKHIAMKAPGGKGSSHYNYKGTHSIVLMAVCDARYCFTMVDVGAAGRNSDGGVLKSSTFGKRLASGTLNLPGVKSLPGTQMGANHVFIGDGAFPLGANMLRPFPGQWLSDEKVIFNYRLSRARTKIENAFGILAAKWRIFLGTMPGNIHLVVGVTQAALCLHNWLMKQDYTSRPSARRYILPGEVDSADSEDGAWRQDASCFCSIGQFGSNAYTVAAKKQRDTFVSYFMGKGEVPWQWSRLPRRQV